MTYTNRDVAPHDITSDTPGQFQSATISSGSTPVNGVSSLPPGTYAFHCSIHPFMKGALNVGAGVPSTPPPAIPVIPGLAELLATILGLLGLGPGGTLNPPPPVPSVSVVPVGAVPTPTSVTYGNGSLFVTSYAGGNVFRLPVMANGLLGAPAVHASGFTSPLGVAVAPDGTVFVADSHPSASPGRVTAGRVHAVAPGGGAPAVVIDELPNGRHNTNGMSVRNGRLYITNGNSTDDGVAGGEPEQPLSGTLLSVPVTARGLVVPPPPALPPVDVVVHARGMRNTFDVAFRAGTDEAWMPMNGPDALEPLGEDLLLKADVSQPAVDFGFPACAYSSALPPPHWAQNPAVAPGQLCGGQTPPEALLGLHVSADGLDFGPSDAFWKGDLFIAEYGNNPGETLSGHKIVRVPISASGEAGTPATFLLAATPLGLEFGPAGMYVADFGTGSITLIRPLA